MDDVGGARWVVAAVLIVAGAVVWWIGHLSADDRLRRNRLAGIRTPTTLASDDAWYAAQRAGAGWTKVGGIASALGGVAVAIFADDGPTLGVLVIVISVLTVSAVVGGAVVGVRAARDHVD